MLEIGCGAGGNLLAMAAATPGVQAVGIDLALEPIEEARRAVVGVGLDNVDLRQGDVMDLQAGELGEFDYVIAHGVYAWVPPDVRDALLAACRSHLAADGLAYVSYNAYPGGFLRRALREAGLWFSREEPDPVAAAERAQVLYRYLFEQRAGEGDPWGGMLAKTLPPLADGPVYRLVHDDLSEFWDPVWFSDFAAHAARHGLGYVGDADLGNLLPERVPDEVESEPARAGGGRPDRARAAHRRAALQLLPPVGAVPGQPYGGGRPDAGRDVRLSSPLARAAAPPPSGLLASALEQLRARAPETLAFAELRRALGAEPGPLAEALLEGFGPSW